MLLSHNQLLQLICDGAITAAPEHAGSNRSVPTLEFKNVTRKHDLVLRSGMRCGQMVFFRHEPVPDHAGYDVKGRYNNRKTVCGSKGAA